MRDTDRMWAGKEISVKERPGAAWLTIERAHKHNALARSVLAELAEAVTTVAGRDEIRLVIITGAGERFFAAGGDLVELAEVRTERAALDMTNEARGALDVIRHCPLPVIAFLNGDAIGGGAELALACDLRLQAAHARIGFIQARLAITSAWGGGPDLCQLVGAARALRMMARGELIDATQALDWGLADAVITDGMEGSDLQTFMAPLLACPKQVLRGIKAQTLARRLGRSFEDRRTIEQEHLLQTWLHEDHWRAAENLLSKGKK